jgi:hypothetical protein
MRISLVLLPLSLCAAPALAQPVPPPPPPAIQLPPELTDPATADRLTDAMQSLSQALLDMRVGNLRAALQGRPATPAERRMTVRDLARRDDPDFDRHLNQQIAAARPKIEQGVRAMNKALPEVTEDLQRAQAAIERALANMPDPNYPRR